MKYLWGLMILCWTGAATAADLEASSVLLRSVDKVTGRTSTAEIEIGVPTTLNGLKITAERCLKKPPEETPENAAFLTIEEERHQEHHLIFNGWMFSSNPAISAMEHPVFDIWVLDCLVQEPEITEESQPTTETDFSPVYDTAVEALITNPQDHTDEVQINN